MSTRYHVTKNTKETINMKEYRLLVEKHFYSTKIALECAFVKVQLEKHTHDPREE